MAAVITLYVSPSIALSESEPEPDQYLSVTALATKLRIPPSLMGAFRKRLEFRRSGSGFVEVADPSKGGPRYLYLLDFGREIWSAMQADFSTEHAA